MHFFLQNNKYQLQEQIGQGSFGTVYKGIITESKKQIAVKQIKIASIAENEIRIQQKCTNTNIVQIIDMFDESKFTYIVMELCEYGDLRMFMTINFGKKSVPEDFIQIFAQQIVSAFMHLKERNIIHRDIKLDNIVLNNNLEFKIADFGFSTDSNGQSFVGTLIYMSIELLKKKILKNASKYSSEVDIWSLGCLLFELVEGKPLVDYYNKNNQEINEKIIMQIIDQIQKKGVQFSNKSISQQCKDLIIKMLEIDQKKKLNWDDIRQHPFIANNTYQNQKQEKYRDYFKSKYELFEHIYCYNNIKALLLKQEIDKLHTILTAPLNKILSRIQYLIIEVLIIVSLKQLKVTVYYQQSSFCFFLLRQDWICEANQIKQDYVGSYDVNSVVQDIYGEMINIHLELLNINDLEVKKQIVSKMQAILNFLTMDFSISLEIELEVQQQYKEQFERLFQEKYLEQMYLNFSHYKQNSVKINHKLEENLKFNLNSRKEIRKFHSTPQIKQQYNFIEDYFEYFQLLNQNFQI